MSSVEVLLDQIEAEGTSLRDLMIQIARRTKDPGMLADLAATLIYNAAQIDPEPNPVIGPTQTPRAHSAAQQEAFQMVMGKVLHALGVAGRHLQIWWPSNEYRTEIMLGQGVALHPRDLPNMAVEHYHSPEFVRVGPAHGVAQQLGYWPTELDNATPGSARL